MIVITCSNVSPHSSQSPEASLLTPRRAIYIWREMLKPLLVNITREHWLLDEDVPVVVICPHDPSTPGEPPYEPICVMISGLAESVICNPATRDDYARKLGHAIEHFMVKEIRGPGVTRVHVHVTVCNHAECGRYTSPKDF